MWDLCVYLLKSVSCTQTDEVSAVYRSVIYSFYSFCFVYPQWPGTCCGLEYKKYLRLETGGLMQFVEASKLGEHIKFGWLLQIREITTSPHTTPPLAHSAFYFTGPQISLSSPHPSAAFPWQHIDPLCPKHQERFVSTPVLLSPWFFWFSHFSVPSFRANLATSKAPIL